MRTGGGQELPSQNEPVRAEVYGEFARIEEAERQAAASVTMLALVNRAQARLEIAAPPTTESSSSSSPAVAKHSEDGSSSFSKSDEQSRMRTKDEDEAEEPPGAREEVHTAAKSPDIEAPRQPISAKGAKSVSDSNIAPISPTATSSTDANESFPL
jgi:hypothetical protein